jgi:hypothetical protein
VVRLPQKVQILELEKAPTSQDHRKKILLLRLQKFLLGTVYIRRTYCYPLLKLLVIETCQISGDFCFRCFRCFSLEHVAGFILNWALFVFGLAGFPRSKPL